MSNKATEFLQRHNYILTVRFDNNVVSCNFNKVKWSYKYIELENDLYKIELEYGDKKEELYLSAFLVRWYIFLDLLRFCRNNKLSYYIIKYFDANNQEGCLESLMVVNFSEKSLEKEIEIGKYVIQATKNKTNVPDKDLEALGLLYSWNILKGLLV